MHNFNISKKACITYDGEGPYVVAPVNSIINFSESFSVFFLEMRSFCPYSMFAHLASIYAYLYVSTGGSVVLHTWFPMSCFRLDKRTALSW